MGKVLVTVHMQFKQKQVHLEIIVLSEIILLSLMWYTMIYVTDFQWPPT